MVDHLTPWGLVEMNPPSAEQADELSRFLQSQASPGYCITEKNAIHRWKICNNEARPGFACAMAIQDSGETISICTVTPKRLWRNGTEQFWGEVGDAFTDPAYHRKGMFTVLVNANRAMAQAAGVDIIYSVPDDQSMSLPPFIKKCDFAVKEDLKFSNHFAILGTKAIAARGLVSRVAWLRRMLGSSVGAAASRGIFSRLLALALPRNPHVEVAVERTFGTEFDVFWQRVRNALPNAQVRDARYLNWRFGESPFPFKVLVARVAGEIVGYAATLTVRHAGEDAFSHAILLDWLYDASGAQETGAVLLSATMKQAIEDKADVVSAVACTTGVLKMPFARCGFMRRPRDMSVVLHRNPAGRALLDDPSPWHFTLSDTDAF